MEEPQDSNTDAFDIAITRTVETEYTNHADEVMDSDDGDMNATGSRNYPDTPTSPFRSIGEIAHAHPQISVGHGGTHEWRQGQPYCRDHPVIVRPENRIGNIKE